MITQSAIQAAIDVVSENAIEPARVAHVEARFHDCAFKKPSWDPKKLVPKDRETADHSFPYCFAVAMIDRACGPEQFTDAKLKDPDVRALMNRIELVLVAELTALLPDTFATVIAVTLDTGERFESLCRHAPGHMKNRLSDAEVEDKFRRLAAGVLTDAGADVAIAGDMGPRELSRSRRLHGPFQDKLIGGVMGVTEDLARMVVETLGETLSAGTILESVKMRFLDGIAIMLAGSREPATLISLDVVREMGGKGRATIPGHADRAPAPLAGYVNGVSAHSQEYDDYTRGGGHLTVSLVPGSLVIAEDAGLSGRGLIEGFVVGFEVATRIAHGMNPHLFDGGFHQNCLFGALGVAAAGARMRGLDQMGTRMAIGIAASEGTGLRRNVGSMAKAFHVGHGVRNGVFAVMLAERGYRVNPDILEGTDEAAHARFGLVDTYNGLGNYSLDKMIEGLGDAWELAKDTTVVCFHPGSTTQAATIDAVIELAEAHDIRLEEVERIELACTPEALKRACYMEPRRPTRLATRSDTAPPSRSSSGAPASPSTPTSGSRATTCRR